MKEVLRLMYKKSADTYCEYKRSFQRLLDTITISTDPLTPSTITRWIQHDWDAGRSPSSAVKAISFLDTLRVALAPNSFSPYMKNSTIAYYLKSWEEAWKRKGKKERRPISWEQALLLSKTPPPKVDQFKWKCYVLFAWSFMLRHGEIRRVTPAAVQYIEQSGNWELTLGECKTTKEKGLSQVARFHTRLLPTEVIPLLKTFSSIKTPNFDWGINKHNVSPHLRSVLKTEDKGYVFHSLRHGRATHLRRINNVNDPDLKVLGRWLSSDALNCYLHC